MGAETASPVSHSGSWYPRRWRLNEPMPHDNALINLIIVIIKFPFMVVGYLLKYRLALVVIAVLVVGSLVYRAYSNSQQAQSPVTVQVPYYQEIAPGKDLAPQVVQTIAPDGVFYVSSFTEDKETVTLTGYYFYRYKVWEKGTLPLPLNKLSYKKIVVYNR